MKTKLRNLLLWSQKYTKTDMLYLAEGGFWLALGHMFFITTSVLITVAFANLVPKHVYGIYQFVISTGSTINSFSLTGMFTSVKRASALGDNGSLRYGFKKQLSWSIGAVIISGTLAIYYFLQGNTTLGTSFLIVGACTPLIESFSLFRAFLLGKKLFKETTFIGFWRRPIIVVSILTALYFTDNPVVLISVFYVSSAISLGSIYLHVVKKYRLPISRNTEMLKYSKQLSAIGILRTVANNIDTILIFHYLGATQVAVFALARLPLTHLQKTFGLIGNLVFPKFTKREYTSIKDGMLRKLLIGCSVGVGMALLYIAAAPLLFKVLFPEYIDSILLSQVLILAIIFKPATLFGQFFEAHKKIRVQQILLVATLLVKILSSVILLPILGIWGGVYAVLITNIFWALISAIIFYSSKTES